MESTIRIPLSAPISANGAEVRELVLRRPKVKDLRVIDDAKGEVDKVVTLAAHLADVPPSSINDMDAADFVRLATALAGFFGVSLPTGAT
ncbi:MAG: phage tail assembly protein [Rhodospirillales bacterium]|jgi:hypothetical protein|nr:phage tail assembly protein [Rhodospirillales bacterium]